MLDESAALRLSSRRTRVVLYCRCAGAAWISGFSSGMSISNLSGVLDDAAFLAALGWGAGEGDASRQKENLTSMLQLGALLISPVAGVLADRAGRKWALSVSAVLQVLGSLLAALAPTLASGAAAGGTFAALLAGRLLAGAGLGLSLHSAPLHVNELSHASSRAALGSSFQACVCMGLLVSTLTNLRLLGDSSASGDGGDDDGGSDAVDAGGSAAGGFANWQVSLALPAAPALLVWLVLALPSAIAIPESPRWLASRAAKRAQASGGQVVVAAGSSADSGREALLLVGQQVSVSAFPPACRK